MQKVFSALVLTSFLAVLLVPITASALSQCPQCTLPPYECECSGTKVVGQAVYCYNNIPYSNLNDCTKAAASGVTAITGDIGTPEGLVALIQKIGTYIAMVLYAVAGVLLIVAGFMWVTAGGNPEGVKAARTMLINALIGVAIALVASGAVRLIQYIVPKTQ